MELPDIINSNIHPSIFSKQEQLDMQYLLKRSDYPFLRYDSFLCATNITKRKIGHIANSMAMGETEVVDVLKEEHLAEVLDMVRASRLFSRMDKELFFY